MRALRLVSVFIFFLLLGGSILLLASQAYAQSCCGCGACDSGCTCPGESAECYWCAAGDSETFQSKVPAATGRVDIRAIREPLPSTVANSDVTERLVELTRGGKRVSGNFILKMLGNIADGLKFACPGSADKNMRVHRLAFQMEANKVN